VVTRWQECTHLISTGIKRTTKFLCALSSGKFIVTTKWLDACRKSGSFVGANKFMLKDAKSEKTYRCTLKKSLELTQQADCKKLFSGLKFYATPSVKPATDDLSEMLNAAGGTVPFSNTACTPDARKQN
jgi:Regulator of Ty1 transposition protein 107 BRCT domain